MPKKCIHFFCIYSFFMLTFLEKCSIIILIYYAHIRAPRDH